MTHELLHDYSSEIKELEEETAKASDEILSLQDRKFLETVREITQSILTVSRENDSVHVSNAEDKPVDNASEFAIDLTSMDKSINGFNELVELLKTTYLEQESLDFFLRYTLSSSDLLHLNSIYDDKYVKLEDEVKTLRGDKLNPCYQEVERTKSEIIEISDELAKTQDKVNEVLLETTEVLENCDEMMKELDMLREDHKIKNDRLREREQDPVVKLYQDWVDLRGAEQEYQSLTSQLRQWQNVKNSYISAASLEEEKSCDDSARLKRLEFGTTLDNLIKLWESKFLPNNGWSNLELYPQSRKFQFDVSSKFTVVIKLNVGALISDIKVYKKEDSMIFLDENLENVLKETHLGARDIFKAMEGIIETLKKC